MESQLKAKQTWLVTPAPVLGVETTGFMSVTTAFKFFITLPGFQLPCTPSAIHHISSLVAIWQGWGGTLIGGTAGQDALDEEPERPPA
jgi:hypothetical protein